MIGAPTAKHVVSGTLADGLVDELHLFVYPVTVGGGPRLFPDGAPEMTLALAESETYSNGVLHLNYLPSAG